MVCQNEKIGNVFRYLKCLKITIYEYAQLKYKGLLGKKK